MNQPANFSALQQQPVNLQIIKQVAEQLDKDFRSIGVEITLADEANAHYELRAQVLATVDYFMENRLEKLFTLLYRIDLPEEKIKKALSGDSPLETVTDMILDRELQKVIIRNFYSAKA